MKKVHEIEELQDREAPATARAFIADAHSFERLSRYETAIRRSALRALQELQRRQSTRLESTAPSSAPIEVGGTYWSDN